ncbi:unnamed protein product [Cyprideis torosa]|uniref:Uncharacterized protein n=1 Tax=Cyprideis torosa TaxID=163714 RepID=A0A7R8W640_9CRUS|nr:unnamed protein product [Cyprideis torosa]CAG0881357.1 unnamed protein product [Cyprideis torosa]
MYHSTPQALKGREPFDPNDIVSAPIDNLGPGGRLIRHLLLRWTLSDTWIITRLQDIRTPFLNSLMRNLAFLVSEEFYILLVLAFLWCGDPVLARRILNLVAATFYLCSVLKDSTCLPRPPCPPAIPLEDAQDWSMPSQHSSTTMAVVPYMYAYSMAHNPTVQRHQSLFATLVVLWTALVPLSRYYLAVHSLADLVVGSLLGMVILSTYCRVASADLENGDTLSLQIDSTIDEWLLTGKWVVPQLLLYLAVLTYMHPRPQQPTESLYVTCVGTMASVGINIGFVLGGGVYFIAPPASWYHALGRYCIGLPLAFLLRHFLKLGLTGLVSRGLEAFHIQHFSMIGQIKEMKRTGMGHSKHFHKDFFIPPISQLPLSSRLQPNKLVIRPPRPNHSSDGFP